MQLRRLLALGLLATAITAHAELFITPASPDYPSVTHEQRSAIARMLVDQRRYNEPDLWQAIDAAEHGRPLSPAQANQVREVLAPVQRAQQQQAAGEQARRQQAAQATQEKLADEQAQRRAEDEQRGQRFAAEQASQRLAIYRSTFQNIQSPEDAKGFIDKYQGADPDGLAPGAMKRGYDRGIKEAVACIDFSKRTIDAEHEIGRTVGYENKVSLYQAGRNLIVCRQRLARYKSEAAHLP